MCCRQGQVCGALYTQELGLSGVGLSMNRILLNIGEAGRVSASPAADRVVCMPSICCFLSQWSSSHRFRYGDCLNPSQVQVRSSRNLVIGLANEVS